MNGGADCQQDYAVIVNWIMPGCQPGLFPVSGHYSHLSAWNV